MRKKDFLKEKRFYLVIFVLLFILHPLNLFGQGENIEKTFKVEIKNNLISVYVQNAELSDVLQEIEKGTGVEITIGKELVGKKITSQFENFEVEGALREILRDNHYILTLFQDPENKEKHILKEVKVEGTVIGSKSYKGEMITIEIPYGSGEGEVGAVDEGEGVIIGPKSFTIDDKGNIYICDTVNNRVQIFSRDGKHLSAIPLEMEAMAEDIAVDSSGFVYIYDQLGKLYQYDKKGNMVNKINVGWRGGGTMHIINNEIYMYACDFNTCGDFIIGRVLNNVLVGPSAEELKRFKEPLKGKQGLSGKKYMTSLKRFEKGELKIEDRESTAFKILSFPFKNILSIKFLGEDKRGDLYIKTERDNENQELVVEVHKFNPHGDYLGTIQMPPSNIRFWSVKNYSISKNGIIYGFLPEKDKLRLNIFPS
ncbi:MAG: hypothetical protein FJ241_02275 [Nitrospira sp.]|nr:hypothetical protein [Nitrospira sp.]